MLSCILLNIELATTDGSIWLDYSKMLLVLAGVCFLAVYALKFLLPKLSGGSVVAPSRHIEILARQSLESRKTLYLVRAGKSVMLLAASGETMQFMTAVDSQDSMMADALDTAIKTSGFGQRITSQIRKLQNDPTLDT